VTEPAYISRLPADLAGRLREEVDGAERWRCVSVGAVGLEISAYMLQHLDRMLAELRRIRRAVERIAEGMPVATEHGDLLVNRYDEPVGSVEPAGMRAAARVAARQSVSRRCAAAPRVDTAAADAFLKARKEARGG
jgi:hypothetical protein